MSADQPNSLVFQKQDKVGKRKPEEKTNEFEFIFFIFLMSLFTQKFPDTPGSLEGNTEGPGTASSEPLLPS